MWLPNSYGLKQTLEYTQGLAASKDAAVTNGMAFRVQPGLKRHSVPSELCHSWQIIRFLRAWVSSPENGRNAHTCRWFSGLKTAQGEHFARCGENSLPSGYFLDHLLLPSVLPEPCRMQQADKRCLRLLWGSPGRRATCLEQCLGGEGVGAESFHDWCDIQSLILPLLQSPPSSLNSHENHHGRQGQAECLACERAFFCWQMGQGLERSINKQKTQVKSVCSPQSAVRFPPWGRSPFF